MAGDSSGEWRLAERAGGKAYILQRSLWGERGPKQTSGPTTVEPLLRGAQQAEVVWGSSEDRGHPWLTWLHLLLGHWRHTALWVHPAPLGK